MQPNSEVIIVSELTPELLCFFCVCVCFYAVLEANSLAPLENYRIS